MQINIVEYAENYLNYEKTTDGYFMFQRFLEEQKEAYQLNDMYRNGYQATTGVRLRFMTNGDRVQIQGRVTFIKTGILFFFMQPTTHYQEIGKCKKRIPPKGTKFRNAEEIENTGFELVVDGSSQGHRTIENGSCSFPFMNPNHEWKEVTIYLPQNAMGEVKAVEVNGEVKKAKAKNGKLLSLGDSITAGRIGRFASNSYVMQLAEKLQMEALNQGVPGYTFYSDSLSGLEKLTFEPQLITIAYGTNDWNFAPNRECVQENIQKYFAQIQNLFPETPKVVITPIWRADEEKPSYYGTITEIREYISRDAKAMQHVTVVAGDELLPHDRELYRDRYVHPDDNGQRLYAEHLYQKLVH